MNLSKALMFWKLGHAGSIVLIVLSTVTAQGQSTSAPIKQGLWQTQMTMSMQMTLPPRGGGKDCGDASGAAGADAVDDGWCVG